MGAITQWRSNNGAKTRVPDDPAIPLPPRAISAETNPFNCGRYCDLKIGFQKRTRSEQSSLQSTTTQQKGFRSLWVSGYFCDVVHTLQPDTPAKTVWVPQLQIAYSQLGFTSDHLTDDHFSLTNRSGGPAARWAASPTGIKLSLLYDRLLPKRPKRLSESWKQFFLNLERHLHPK